MISFQTTVTEYATVSTIQGVVYIFDWLLPWFDRIFWVIVVLASCAISIYMSVLSYNNWQVSCPRLVWFHLVYTMSMKNVHLTENSCFYYSSFLLVIPCPLFLILCLFNAVDSNQMFNINFSYITFELRTSGVSSIKHIWPLLMVILLLWWRNGEVQYYKTCVCQNSQKSINFFSTN